MTPARQVPALDLHFPVLDPHSPLPDRISLLLDDLAPAAVHERGDEGRPVWRVFLTDVSRVDEAALAIADRAGPDGVRVERVFVDDEDWAARSQAHLTRVTVGAITVAPPWDAAAPATGDMVIVHPSTGFGTGHHETTRLCLHLLQQVPIEGRRVLDLGTGSGVLALAAWRLGAREIEAVDYDEDAIVNARENVALNGAGGAVVVRQLDLRQARLAAADVVTANLTGAMLLSVASMLARLVTPRGTLIVSGVFASESDAVAAALGAHLSLVAVRSENDWRALQFENDRDPVG